MPQHGAVEFAQPAADALALDVVGFAQVQGDQAVLMAGEHLAAVRGPLLQHVEGEAVLRILGPAQAGQAQPDQAVEQPVLGGLGALPGDNGVGAQLGDHPVVAAGEAEPFPGELRDQPVAGLVRGVVAETVAVAGPADGTPGVAAERIDRHQLGGFRQIADARPATAADGVLEEQQLAATPAVEEFHGGPGRSPGLNRSAAIRFDAQAGKDPIRSALIDFGAFMRMFRRSDFPRPTRAL